MTDQTLTEEEVRSLLSVPKISRLTGHSIMCVYRAIERLKLQPRISFPYKLYPPAVVETLKENMRSPRSKAHGAV